MSKEQEEAFEAELTSLLNRYSRENGSHTPDFILANYLVNCLRAWNLASEQRDRWYCLPQAAGNLPARPRGTAGSGPKE